MRRIFFLFLKMISTNRQRYEAFLPIMTARQDILMWKSLKISLIII